MNLVHKAVVVSGGQVIVMAIAVTTGIILSRNVGPAGMGQYELIVSTGNLVATISALGIGTASIYFFNNLRVSREQLITDLLRFGVGAGALISLAVMLAVAGTPSYFGAMPWFAATLMGIATGASFLRNLLRPSLVADLAVRRMVVVDVVQAAMLLCGAGIVLLLKSLDPSDIVILYSLSVCASTIVLLWFLHDRLNLRCRFDYRLFKQLMKYGMKLGAASILFVLSSSITLIGLRLLVPEGFGEIGLYTRANAIAGLATLVPHTLGPLLYAKWSGAPAKGRAAQVEMASRLGMAYGLCVAFVLACGGGTILLRVMYGEAFVPATTTLAILGFGLVGLTVFGPFNHLLVSTGHAGRTVPLLATSFLVQVVALLALVPRFGIEGAASATLLSNTTLMVHALAVSSARFRIAPQRCFLLQWSDMLYIRRAILMRDAKTEAAVFEGAPRDAAHMP